MVEIDAALVAEAVQLDQSTLNRSNIAVSRLSMNIAHELLRSTDSDTTLLLAALERKHAELASAWNDKSNRANKPPFCCIEGLKYAINAAKVRLLQEKEEDAHVMVIVPFYCEFERGMPASAENPNGEDSPIQKLEEALFLLQYNDTMSMNILFVNDVIAEKKDDENGGSARLFKQSLLAYAAATNLTITLQKKDKAAAADYDFDSFSALHGHLCVTFTSCEQEATKPSRYESAHEKRTRFENRSNNGKLRERKGGAVLAGMELEPPTKMADHLDRVIKCLVDGDSAHPVASFVGDAVYSIRHLKHAAYLGNLKHAHTVVSVVEPEEDGGGSAGTRAKVQNRKLFFSGFLVPCLFPELASKYKYTGTTQLPVKAFRGDINFAQAKLPTVQPDVDLGMLALLCSHLDSSQHGTSGSIDSGPVTIRDNIASSTMTTSDLNAEWTKTYGPIFTSAAALCRRLKPDEYRQLPVWLTSFVGTMELKHYVTLFGEEALDNVQVVALFAIMSEFQAAPDRSVILRKVKACLDQIFAESE